jgi:hypothetical protein
MSAGQGVLIISNWWPRAVPDNAPPDIRFLLEDGPVHDGFEENQLNADIPPNSDRACRRCVFVACPGADSFRASTPILLVELKELTHGHATLLNEKYSNEPQGCNPTQVKVPESFPRVGSKKKTCSNGKQRSIVSHAGQKHGNNDNEPPNKKARGAFPATLVAEGVNYMHAVSRRVSKKSPAGGGTRDGNSVFFQSFVKWLPNRTLPQELVGKSQATVSGSGVFLLPSQEWGVLEAVLICCNAYLGQKNIDVHPLTTMIEDTVTGIKQVCATPHSGAGCLITALPEYTALSSLSNIDVKLQGLDDGEREVSLRLEAIREERTRLNWVRRNLNDIVEYERYKGEDPFLMRHTSRTFGTELHANHQNCSLPFPMQNFDASVCSAPRFMQSGLGGLLNEPVQASQSSLEQVSLGRPSGISSDALPSPPRFRQSGLGGVVCEPVQASQSSLEQASLGRPSAISSDALPVIPRVGLADAAPVPPDPLSLNMQRSLEFDVRGMRAYNQSSPSPPGDLSTQAFAFSPQGSTSSHIFTSPSLCNASHDPLSPASTHGCDIGSFLEPVDAPRRTHDSQDAFVIGLRHAFGSNRRLLEDSDSDDEEDVLSSISTAPSAIHDFEREALLSPHPNRGFDRSSVSRPQGGTGSLNQLASRIDEVGEHVSTPRSMIAVPQSVGDRVMAIDSIVAGSPPSPLITCPLCLSCIDSFGERCESLACGHLFHSDCLKKCMFADLATTCQTQMHKLRCPVCRQTGMQVDEELTDICLPSALSKLVENTETKMGKELVALRRQLLKWNAIQRASAHNCLQAAFVSDMRADVLLAIPRVVADLTSGVLHCDIASVP